LLGVYILLNQMAAISFQILNYITKYCISHTCVTWQGTNYEHPDDDTIVSKHVGGV